MYEGPLRINLSSPILTMDIRYDDSICGVASTVAGERNRSRVSRISYLCGRECTFWKGILTFNAPVHIPWTQAVEI